MADVKKGGGPARPLGPRPSEPLGPKRVPPQVTGARIPVPFAPGQQGLDARQLRDRDEEQPLLFEARLGDPSITSDELRAMSSLMAGRHLMTLLSKRREGFARADLIREVGELLLGMDDGPWARRLLLQMVDAGRIVDIYPLEVMAWLIENHPGSVDRADFGSVVLNKAVLENRTHAVGGIIVFKVPLSLKMKAFALEGGTAPGYVMAPGPPARYLLEVHAPAEVTVLVRGDIRKTSFLDRVRLNVEDVPESDP